MAIEVPRWQRRRRNAVVWSLLGGAILTSYTLAFALKLGMPSSEWAPWFGRGLLPALLIQSTVLALLGVHRGMWRYAGLRDLLHTGQAIGLAGLLILVAAVAMPAPPWLVAVACLDFVLSLVLVGGARMAPRILLEFWGARAQRRRAVVLGAGDAGEALVRELARSPQAQFEPVAILDDDPAKKGKRLNGVPVVGSLDAMGEVACDYDASCLLLAIYALPTSRERELRAMALETGLPLKRVPSLAELLSGQARIDQLTDFSLEELLDRTPIRTDHSPVHELVGQRTVLITGAAGSIGSELSRQVLDSHPRRLLLLDHDENALFEIDNELRLRAGDTDIQPLLCSVRDAPKLRDVFAEHHPDVVFHAAAYKHVPVLEHFPEEAVRNNVQGTLNVASLSDRFGVERFVLISTDKAVRPTSVMGTTKRVAELIVADLDRNSRTRFSTIRFGNVLGSNGSVMQVFQDQIARGGPVTVTHPEMRRYFMSIPEAVELVLFAASMEEPASTYILDMGQQVRILDLAHHFIRLCGLEPGRDIEVRITGLRPGEKLYEELWTDVESPLPTGHSGVLRAPRDQAIPTDLPRRVATLIDWAHEGNRAEIVFHLRDIVPEYTGDPLRAESVEAGATSDAEVAVTLAEAGSPSDTEVEAPASITPRRGSSPATRRRPRACPPRPAVG